MANIDRVNKYLQEQGYDPNARFADYRDPKAYAPTKVTAPTSNFVGNVAKSLSGIPGAIQHSVGGMLAGSSFAKAPQIIRSIQDTGFSGFGINYKGKVGQTLDRRDALMKQATADFHAGKMSPKAYSAQLQKIIADTSVDKKLEKSKGALKDASRYGEQFVNNAAIIGTVVGGIAGAAGKTGLNAAGTAAVDQAYSGGVKALGKGVLGEVGALSRPFGGEAAGGLVKGITGALGGALDAQAMASTVNDARKGKIDPLNTALTATSLAPGGVVKLGSEALSKIGKAASSAIYDTHGLYDVVKLKGGKTVNEVFAAAKAAQKATDTSKQEKILKVFQDLAVQEHGKGPNAVAKAIEANQPGGKKFADMTYNEFLKAADSIISDRRKLQAIAKKAGLAVDGAGVVAGRLTPEAKAIISERLSQADDPLAEFAKLKKEGIPGMSITKDSSKVATSSKPPVKIKSDKNGTMYLAAGKTKITVPKTVQADLDNIANGIALSPERMAKSSRTLNRLGYEFDNKMGIVPIVQKTTQKVSSSVPVRNTNLFGQIEEMVKSGATGEQLAKQVNTLKSVQAALVDGKPVVTKDGRFLAFAKGAGTVKKASEVAPIVQGSKAPLGVIGRTLEKAGLSTRQADPAEQKAIFRQVKDNFAKAINDNADIKLTGSEIMNRLNKLSDSKRGVFDLRQLRTGEIAHELGVPNSQAKAIISAYNDAFKSLSTAERGLAGKITDFNMRNNPLAAPYSRIQSVARYELNPSFRTQENIETGIGSQLLGGKAINPLTDKYNKGVKILEDNGFFKRELAGPAGEGAAGLGAISAKLSPFQKKKFTADLMSLAGGENKLVGFVTDPKNASLVQDLKSIAQYPDRGFTSSNLMKAMNLAVFPLRYNLKVTSIAAKALGKENGIRQMAILKGLSDFNRWQKTPAGIKWNSDNSEVLGVLRYFTPVGSVESVLNMLDPRNIKNARDLGTIGGLPFGVISGVLQGQGVVNLDSPYLNPKTGEVVPTQVPKDVKARLSQALEDVIGTMFTYPGRQIGLPKSKKDVSKDLAAIVTLGQLKGGKYESVTRTDLTPAQRKQQAVLQAGQKKVNLTPPAQLKNRSVNLSSSKPVTITPIYKASKPKKAKTRAIPVGRFQP